MYVFDVFLKIFVMMNWCGDVGVIVATASTCNVILMRYNELFEGIEILDEAGHTVGTSKAAAKKVCFCSAVFHIKFGHCTTLM